MREVYFIRHGSVDNPQGIKYGRMEGFPLSGRGVKEAGETARFLGGRGIEIIYHSPLERCRQTASIINRALGVNLVESGEINEWDENESLRDVQSRMNTFWMTLYAQSHEIIAVVSHRDPLRALMLGFTGSSLSDIYKPEVLPLPPGGVWLVKPGMGKTTHDSIFTPVIE